MKVASPCLRICRLDEHDICAGCGRKRDEITLWLHMTDPERAAVCIDAAARRQGDIFPSPARESQ